MSTPDAHVLVDHLRHRFVSNGVPLSDYEAIRSRLTDWAGWCATWEQEGDARMVEADAAEREGSLLTAAELRLVAALEYHFAKFLFLHDPAQLRAAHEKCLSAYRRAAPLLAHPARFLEVSHAGGPLVGVLRRPTRADGPVATVIVVPGLDATKEEMHLLCEAFLERGMATFTFDGPGQGEAEYDRYLPAHWEYVAASVVEALALESVVDTDRIAVVGVSLGGYFAARAGALTPGLRAAASVGGCFSMGDAWDGLSWLSQQAFRVRSGAGDDADLARRTAHERGQAGP